MSPFSFLILGNIFLIIFIEAEYKAHYRFFKKTDHFTVLLIFFFSFDTRLFFSPAWEDSLAASSFLFIHTDYILVNSNSITKGFRWTDSKKVKHLKPGSTVQVHQGSPFALQTHTGSTPVTGARPGVRCHPKWIATLISGIFFSTWNIMILTISRLLSEWEVIILYCIFQ